MKPFNFNRRVWAALKLIPRGRVTTYKELAKYLGKSKVARAVGNACGLNPYAPKVPCHRVVKSDGSLGGYSGGGKKKIDLLEKEGVKIDRGKIKDFRDKLYKFK
jgi:O-6-methylguanine DNA methyltransferase